MSNILEAYQDKINDREEILSNNPNEECNTIIDWDTIFDIIYSKINSIAYLTREENLQDNLFNDHSIIGFQHRNVLGSKI